MPRYDDEGFFDSFFGEEEERQQAFNFESILNTEIAVQLEAYDLKNTNEHDLASLSPKEKKSVSN